LPLKGGAACSGITGAGCSGIGGAGWTGIVIQQNVFVKITHQNDFFNLDFVILPVNIYLEQKINIQYFNPRNLVTGNS
jgi:hypothetical protein